MSRANKLAVTTSSQAPFGAATNLEMVRSPKTEKKNPFEVTSTEIPSRTIKFDAERLVQRPSYKIRRHKFDITKTECIDEKNNDPMTM